MQEHASAVSNETTAYGDVVKVLRDKLVEAVQKGMTIPSFKDLHREHKGRATSIHSIDHSCSPAHLFIVSIILCELT